MLRLFFNKSNRTYELWEYAEDEDRVPVEACIGKPLKICTEEWLIKTIVENVDDY